MSFFIHLPDHILFEDGVILVVNKPHGLMVEPDRNGHPNLLQQVKSYLKSVDNRSEVYAQHIHRLDRPVSGVVLFAKRREVLRNLSEQFAQRQVEKHYQALTTRPPALWQGTLSHWHRKEKKKAVLQAEEFPYAEQAELAYSVKEKSANRFLWDIRLHTGKFHQIRAQLASLDCPIVGDALYGSTEPYYDQAIALHAGRLVFRHPLSGEKLTIESPWVTG